MNPTTLSETTFTIHRKLKSERFTSLDNELLRNIKLSFRARGMLAHLLSYPAGWRVHMSNLISEEDGRHSVRSGLKELIERRYLFRRRTQDTAGRLVGWTYLVFEEPVSDELATKLLTEGRFSPLGGFTEGRFTDVGQSPLIKTDDYKDGVYSRKSDSLRESDGSAVAAPDFIGDGLTPADIAAAQAEEEERQSEAIAVVEPAQPLPAQQAVFGLKSEDEGTKTFPWRQIMAVLARHCPDLKSPKTGDRRDAAMKKFWRDHGKTVGCFELLAQKVAASDFLMARNGHTGKEGRPYSWGWIFEKNAKGMCRAEAIMEGGYSTEAMTFVLEKAENKKATRVLVVGKSQPTEANLKEIWNGEPRYRVCGESVVFGVPEVIDYKD